MKMEYKFTIEELKTWFIDNQIREAMVNESNLDFLTKTICDIKGLSFDNCSNVRIETCELYAPKMVFDYDKPKQRWIRQNLIKNKKEK